MDRRPYGPKARPARAAARRTCRWGPPSVRRPAPARCGEAGLALVEVLVALVLVTLMSTGLAALSGLAVEAAHVARERTSAVTLAADRLEDLRALTWAGGQAGHPRVTDTTTDLASGPAAGGGTGLRPSPTDALETNVAGYVDFLDQRGRLVGGGPVAPADAVFVRRWSVRPSDSGPADALVLRVLVTTVARDRARGAGPARLTAPVVLSTIKGRRDR